MKYRSFAAAATRPRRSCSATVQYEREGHFMLTKKPFLGFNRWTDRCTFTASSAAAGFEAANLGTLPLGVPWAEHLGADQ
jgi:hypothetical protein